ncbi:unnamed protein product [Cunninghamella blakesleeana]
MVTTRRSAAANKTRLLPVVDNPEKIRSHIGSEKNNEANNTKVVEEKEEEKEEIEQINKNDTESEEESESDSVEESDSDEDNSESEEESDSEDDDLNDLLEKAQKSLKEKQDSILKLDEKMDPYKQTNFKLPKLNPGVNPEDELYIKDNEKSAAKLGSDTVSVIESKSSSENNNNKALVTLQKVEGKVKYPSRKERQLEREKTTGKGWFDMPRTEITPEIKRDLEILKMRHILDRKRHYKKMGKNSDPTYFQVGTVIEGATEFFSSRINKKDRKRTFVDEILGNDEQREYYRNKYLTSQQAKSSGGKKHYKKLKAKRSL